MTEKFLDHDLLDALLQEEGRGRMPEVMKADTAQAGFAEERGEGVGEVVGAMALPGVVNAYPDCCHVVPAASRSCCWSWWCFSD